MTNQFAVRVVVIACTTQHTERIGTFLLADHDPGPGWMPDEVGCRAMERVTFDCDDSQLGLEVGSAGVLSPASAALSYVDHFRSRRRGRPVKRKREDWARPGLGHSDNGRISKPVEPCQQPSQESYVAKHAESSRLEKENSQLQVTHASLVVENTQLNSCCRGEEARLCHFREAVQKLRDGVIGVFEKWENLTMMEAAAAGGAGEPTPENENVAVIVPAVHFQEDEGTSASQ
ncbi:hypothetical protein CBS76997_11254 [Aspergillus niger]|nr:hypothetical protein CBS13152_11391 [Aspergillus niger]KAI3033778.1 hypothetical protein CBS76997_11254 [Aspergillus niger]